MQSSLHSFFQGASKPAAGGENQQNHHDHHHQPQPQPQQQQLQQQQQQDQQQEEDQDVAAMVVQGKEEEEALEEESEEEEESLEEESEEEKRPKGGGMSDYERIRQENIARNEEFLRSLGLDSLKPVAEAPSAQASRQKASAGKKRARREEAVVYSGPARRSARVANGPPLPVYSEQGGAADDAEEDEGGEEDEEDQNYDDSDVLKYVMKAGEPGDCEEEKEEEAGPGASLRSLSVQSPEPLASDDLAAIYSMQFYPHDSSLLLAAGKGGMVALFKVGPPSEVLLSFKAHARWVSAAKFFCPPGAADDDAAQHQQQMRVLTAADDGLVKLWDLSKVRQKNKVPALLASSASLHSKGIFDMDVLSNGWVLTGSKDKNVVHSVLRQGGGPASLVQQAVYEWHSSCVKTVAWRSSGGREDCPDGTLFASGGQDRSVYVKDVRSRPNGSAADISIEDIHAGGVHTVSWCPASSFASPFDEGGESSSREHLLLTAGADPTIHVFDIRFIARAQRADPSAPPSPLFSFRGHHYHGATGAGAGKKFATIIPPRFLGSGAVVTAGEKSDHLSLYSTTSGATLSRGEMPEQPMSVAVSHHPAPGKQRVAVACRGGLVYLCRPNYV